MNVRPVAAHDAEAVLADAMAAVDHLNAGRTAAQGSGTRRWWIPVGVLGVLVVALLVSARTTAVVLTSCFTLVYVLTVWHRMRLVRHALRRDPSIHISDAEARLRPDDELPVYTVLIPAYSEPEVLAGLVGALERLEKNLTTKYQGTQLLDGAGHWVQQEQPAELSRLLIEFLKRNA